MEKTYTGWQDFGFTSKQTEHTKPTKLLDADGTLLVKGWARHNVFDYDRHTVKKVMRRKEWDFYQLSNGKYMVQISFANISLGGYASAVLVDLQNGKTIASQMGVFLGGKDKYVLPPKGDVPNVVKMTVGGAALEFNTKETSRTLYFKKGDIECDFTMDILPDHENITTVLPFKGFPDRYFMTTKQNCMPCAGTFKNGDTVYEFSKDDTFCVLDWGRVNTPYKLVWYWGNGSTYVTDENGQKHLFGFEITWGIGDESNATETCIFYDGKAHKFGAVDVEVFPKPDRYMQPWHFISEDGRFDMTMQPFYDHHGDTNALVMRMHSHQVHGLWSGKVTLDDGTVLEIKDMYAFCEYVENRW
ncbi:MAG: DUF2804 domain-containing protein [Clostridia bacterium]|nr:DUF2804 domain-containing protein [Clostridia bacterium]